MRNVSNTARSFGYGETSWTTGNVTGNSSRDGKSLIAKANSVPLLRLLRYYNVKIDAVHHNSICPFKSHKGGRERTGSFYFYSETNSFYCYGCKIGGPQKHAVDFMVAMEGIAYLIAAQKIIALFSEDVDPNAEYIDSNNTSERLEIMMDFSNTVREFRKLYSNKESQDFIEKRCATYDELNTRRNMSNETLRSVVDHLKEQIKIYISCHVP